MNEYDAVIVNEAHSLLKLGFKRKDNQIKVIIYVDKFSIFIDKDHKVSIED